MATKIKLPELTWRETTAKLKEAPESDVLKMIHSEAKGKNRRLWISRMISRYKVLRNDRLDSELEASLGKK